MARKLTSAFKVAIVTAAASAVFFTIFGGLTYGYTLPTILFLSSLGAILGAIGAPHIEPKAFSHPITWQVCFSILGCLLIAFSFQAGPEGYALATIIGGLLGYAAPTWVKHIQGP